MYCILFLLKVLLTKACIIVYGSRTYVCSSIPKQHCRDTETMMNIPMRKASHNIMILLPHKAVLYKKLTNITTRKQTYMYCIPSSVDCQAAIIILTKLSLGTMPQHQISNYAKCSICGL